MGFVLGENRATAMKGTSWVCGVCGCGRSGRDWFRPTIDDFFPPIVGHIDTVSVAVVDFIYFIPRVEVRCGSKF